MKVIDVKDQVRLSAAKCLELVMSGIKFRLFRAAVTVIIVALAVAFLMTMLTESLITRDVSHTIRLEAAPRNTFLFWVGRLNSPFTSETLTDQLAMAEPGDNRWQEFRRWGDLTDEQMAKLVDVSRREKTYLDYFTGLTEGDQAVLYGRARGTEIFTVLLDENKFQEFSGVLKQLERKLPSPGGTGDDVAEFHSFLMERKNLQPLRERIDAGHAEALVGVKEMLNGQPVDVALAKAGPSFPEKIAAFGYRMSPETFQVVQTQARLKRDTEMLERMMNVPRVKEKMARSLNIAKINDLSAEMMFDAVNSVGGAERFLGQVKDVRGQLDALLAKSDVEKKQLPTRDQSLLSFRELFRSFNLSPQRIAELADAKLAERKLAAVESLVISTTGTEEGFFGFSSRTAWLIVVSMLVCIVGITNAMLMSVTERFREIATMKCLGATDGFIMTNFIMESCMQGLAGGVMGAVLGLLLGGLRCLGKFGTMALTQIPAGELTLFAVGAVGVGIILSALAAVYPAWIAARLAPMEAMRIE